MLSELEDILGPNGMISGADVSMRSTDPLSVQPCEAMAIARPNTTEQVSKILSLCHQKGVSVVPAGGNTGLVHGTSARSDQIVISTERLIGIESIDEGMGTMTVLSGTPLQTIQEAAENRGLYFAVDLGARGSATIGGMIATNAGGNRVIKYGMTREQILGLEVVLADGRVLSSMNGLLKNNTGYDLKQLFIGSEGTLGIVTRAVVRLHSKPIDSVVSLIAIQTFDAVRQVAKSLDQLAGGPCALEVMWGEYYSSVVATAQIANAPLATDYEYYLLVEWFDRGCITGIEQSLGALMEEGKIIDATIAQSERQASEIWAIRDGVEFVSEDLGGAGVGYDISLPVSSMEGYVNGVTQRLKEADSRSRCIAFGHLGDGNLHLITSAQDQVDVDRAVYEPLREFNGSISAEHGIGSKKKPFLKISRTELEIEMMRSLKHWIDPKMILNPGKIF